MLTDEEMKDIEAELAHYPTRRAVCIDALRIVQRHRGWISDQSLKDIAGFLDLRLDELDGVATFYNLIYRKPVGKHVILICDSVTCWLMGYNHMRDHLKARLGVDFGQTTGDGRFTLLPVVCLGACDHAPAMMVDETLYGDLTPDKIDAILEEYT